MVLLRRHPGRCGPCHHGHWECAPACYLLSALSRASSARADYASAVEFCGGCSAKFLVSLSFVLTGSQIVIKHSWFWQRFAGAVASLLDWPRL
jgi:hypothetical protein